MEHEPLTRSRPAQRNCNGAPGAAGIRLSQSDAVVPPDPPSPVPPDPPPPPPEPPSDPPPGPLSPPPSAAVPASLAPPWPVPASVLLPPPSDATPPSLADPPLPDPGEAELVPQLARPHPITMQEQIAVRRIRCLRCASARLLQGGYDLTGKERTPPNVGPPDRTAASWACPAARGIAAAPLQERASDRRR